MSKKVKISVVLSHVTVTVQPVERFQPPDDFRQMLPHENLRIFFGPLSSRISDAARPATPLDKSKDLKYRGSISSEDIPRVYFLFYIIQALVISVRDNSLRHLLEFLQVVHHRASKECAAIFQSRLIDHHGGSLCLDPLHDPLDTALAEVIRITLHSQSIHTNYTFLFLISAVIAAVEIVIVTSLFQYTVSNKIFPGPITFHDRLYQILRYILIISQQLFGIFRQTLSAITDSWIIVMVADSWIQTNPFNDLPRIQSFAFRISIKFVEIRNS